ncbi:hypothetical protein LIER_09366 [Lithospermum erythrorhizon]|uniref:Fe-S metabolism associated domain-containing protein n=1 Tax=Lithospermum erythrorhizon TaxID=34254 RepID=A0AAV3PH15_LITER
MHTSNLRIPSSNPPGFLENFKGSCFLYPFGFHAPSSRKLNPEKPLFFPSLKCIQSSGNNNSVLRHLKKEPCLFSCSEVQEGAPLQALCVSDKVKCLASEFKNLIEPIDRVKRLLHYATLLPPFKKPRNLQENRVKGCTAQVWLEVEMDIDGLIRFKVDSDSEITKGFCSCLIWILDGGEPEEILSVKIDDLFDMNVGMPSRGNSRVNTWQNVLISMQTRTNDVIKERDQIRSPDTSFSSLFVRSNCITVNGRCKEAQV